MILKCPDNVQPAFEWTMFLTSRKISARCAFKLQFMTLTGLNTLQDTIRYFFDNDSERPLSFAGHDPEGL